MRLQLWFCLCFVVWFGQFILLGILLELLLLLFKLLPAFLFLAFQMLLLSLNFFCLGLGHRFDFWNLLIVSLYKDLL